MGFDWSTFVLEIVNFLILVWLLKRFLYKPVMNMVEKRRASVEQTLKDAEDARDEARRLQAGYEEREAQWQQELAQRRKALDEQLDAERDKRMNALSGELDAERERRRSREAQDRAAHEQVLQAQAAAQAARFAARLLERLASPQLQQDIIDLLLDDLGALPDTQVRQLRDAAEAAESVQVASAMAIPEKERKRLHDALSKHLPKLPPLQYAESPELMAGLRIGIGSWELEASLAGELRAFADMSGND